MFPPLCLAVPESVSVWLLGSYTQNRLRFWGFPPASERDWGTEVSRDSRSRGKAQGPSPHGCAPQWSLPPGPAGPKASQDPHSCPLVVPGSEGLQRQRLPESPFHLTRPSLPCPILPPGCTPPGCGGSDDGCGSRRRML